MDYFMDECCKKKTVGNTCKNQDIIAAAVTGKTYCDSMTELMDPAKYNNAAKVDGSDYKAQCCTEFTAMCNSINCPVGMKSIANPESTLCKTITCEVGQCCTPDATTCQ